MSYEELKLQYADILDKVGSVYEIEELFEKCKGDNFDKTSALERIERIIRQNMPTHPKVSIVTETEQVDIKPAGSLTGGKLELVKVDDTSRINIFMLTVFVLIIFLYIIYLQSPPIELSISDDL